MDSKKLVSGGSAGGAVAAAAVYVAGRFKLNLTAEDGTLIASALVATGAFVVHNGIAGAGQLLWRGSDNKPPPPPAVTP